MICQGLRDVPRETWCCYELSHFAPPNPLTGKKQCLFVPPLMQPNRLHQLAAGFSRWCFSLCQNVERYYTSAWVTKTWRVERENCLTDWCFFRLESKVLRILHGARKSRHETVNLFMWVFDQQEERNIFSWNFPTCEIKRR